ncbi:MAG: YbjQ family protein [Verrucomicrobiota bacterium]
MNNQILVTTTPLLDGYKIIKYLGIVRGIVVRSPTISQGFFGGLQSIFGGNVGSYTEMCEQARQEAYDLMLVHGRAMQANAIIGVQYDATEIGGQNQSTEVLCYGTAVVIELSV